MFIRSFLICSMAAGLLVAPNVLTHAAFAYPSALMPSSGAYFGAFSKQRGSESRDAAVLRLESQIGRQLKIDHDYTKWDSPIPMAPQQWDKAAGRIPFINWNARRQNGTVVRWSAIANGSQDAWIRARAQAFRTFAYPVYLTFHHEPENDLSTFGTTADYVAAFRHVVTVFRQEGVTNVAFVWTMMADTFNPSPPVDPTSLYPGDSYVDFIGADGYNWYPGRHSATWRSFAQIFMNVRAFALAHGKPWMAVETGVQEKSGDPGAKAQWYRDALATAALWPDLKAFMYFNSDTVYPWWVDSTSTSLSAFRTIAHASWFNAGSGGPVPPPPSPSPSPSPIPSPPPPTTGTLANSLNVGPNGANVSSSGSGGGGDPFSAVTTQGGATLKYDNTHLRGSFSARHSVPARGNAYYAWSGSLHNWYGRVYVWLDSQPSGDLRLVRAVSGSSLACAIDLLADGTIRVVDSANNVIATIGSRFRTDRWIRIEWHIDQQAGQVQIRLYNSADSTTPSATAISSTGRSIRSSSSQVQLGRSGTEPTAITFWTDDPAISSNGFLGPS
jgi:hypothetical protein